MSGSARCCKGLLSIPVMVERGGDASDHCEEPETALKCYIFPQNADPQRYLAENLLMHPTASTEACVNLAGRRMVRGGGTPTSLGFQSSLGTASCVTPTNHLLRHSSSKVSLPPLDGNDCG